MLHERTGYVWTTLPDQRGHRSLRVERHGFVLWAWGGGGGGGDSGPSWTGCVNSFSKRPILKVFNMLKLYP